MVTGLRAIEVITLFVEDVLSTKAFYQTVFGLDVVHEDYDSTLVRLDNVMINLLDAAQAATLTEPVAVAGADVGARSLLTIAVEDVDATFAELRQHGVDILNGPVDSFHLPTALGAAVRPGPTFCRPLTIA